MCVCIHTADVDRLPIMCGCYISFLFLFFFSLSLFIQRPETRRARSGSDLSRRPRRTWSIGEAVRPGESARPQNRPVQHGPLPAKVNNITPPISFFSFCILPSPLLSWATRHRLLFFFSPLFFGASRTWTEAAGGSPPHDGWRRKAKGSSSSSYFDCVIHCRERE